MINKEYVARLTDATPVDYYVSGNDMGRAWWPWRMSRASASEGTHHTMCDRFVLDSNFQDESVTNADVLAEAVETDADAAVLADVYHDADATVAALREGLEAAATHAYDGTVVLPIQAPHAESARRLLSDVADAPVSVWWGVGGFKDDPAVAKLRAANDLRSVVGPDAHIHGFGFGVTPELAAAVRDDPDLLDSIDNATAMLNSTVSDLAGCDGDNEKATVLAARATAKRLEYLRELTPFSYADEPTRQTTL